MRRTAAGVAVVLTLTLVGAGVAAASDPPAWWSEGAAFIEQLDPQADCTLTTDEFGDTSTPLDSCQANEVPYAGGLISGECYTHQPGSSNGSTPIAWCHFDMGSRSDSAQICDRNLDYNPTAWQISGFGATPTQSFETLDACVAAAIAAGQPQPEPTPTPTPTPTPEPDPVPVAACDVYVTAPGTTLKVPAAHGLLANDLGVLGGGLAPKVTAISFRRSTHPFTVKSNGSLSVKTLSSDKRLVLTYVALSGGKASAPTTALVLVQKKAPPAASLRCTDGTVPAPARSTRGFLNSDCTAMKVETQTFKINDKKRGIKGKLTYGITKPKGDNLCWKRGFPTGKERWTVKNESWAKWTGTPKVADAIGLTDTIEVNGTSISAGLPPSIGFSSTSDGAEETVENTKKGTTNDVSLDYRSAAVTLKGFSSDRISHEVQPWVKLKGSKKLAPKAGDHNCVKLSASGYYWGDTYSSCF